MKPAGVGETGRRYTSGVDEAGEIHSAANALALTKARPALLPGEEAVSLPIREFEHDPVMRLVSGYLGEGLTSASMAWRGDPVPLMRSLQKMLVAHSLTLDLGRRAPAMDAIRTVELAVRWRLRWLQMRRSEAESHFTQPQQEEHAT